MEKVLCTKFGGPSLLCLALDRYPAKITRTHVDKRYFAACIVCNTNPNLQKKPQKSDKRYFAPAALFVRSACSFGVELPLAPPYCFEHIRSLW